MITIKVVENVVGPTIEVETPHGRILIVVEQQKAYTEVMSSVSTGQITDHYGHEIGQMNICFLGMQP